jgi:hypothetical protein
MEVRFELLFEIFGEFVLQFLFEALAEFGVHLLRRPSERRPVSPWLAVAGYAIVGALAGAASVWLFPNFFIQSHAGRALSLLVTPIAAAAAMSLLGAWRRKRGDELVRLDRFTYGYVFAFAMAAVRFAFAEAG